MDKFDFWDGFFSGVVILVILIVAHLLGIELAQHRIAKGENFVRNDIEYRCEAVK